MNADQRTPLCLSLRMKAFGEDDECALFICAFIRDLVRLPEAQLIFRLGGFQRTKIGKEKRIYIENTCACFRLWCVEISRLNPLSRYGECAGHKVDIVPCEPQCFTEA